MVSWLKFMGRLLDHSNTLIKFVQYFKQHSDSLYEILKSIMGSSWPPWYDSCCSGEYIGENIKFISKVINLGTVFIYLVVPPAEVCD